MVIRGLADPALYVAAGGFRGRAGRVYAMANTTMETQMNTKATMAALLVLGLAAGCERHEDGMGPAQKAGKAVDDAGAQAAARLHEPIDKAHQAAQAVADSADQARARIEDATEDARAGLDKATEQVGKKVEKAGEKIQDAAK
jgi:signal transduction protein with GAF and PtsI domain